MLLFISFILLKVADNTDNTLSQELAVKSCVGIVLWCPILSLPKGVVDEFAQRMKAFSRAEKRRGHARSSLVFGTTSCSLFYASKIRE